MVPDVAAALARLGQRDRFTGQDDFVFAGEEGGPLDGSALRRRYMKATASAGLRPLRFHDLRHAFGTLAASAVLSGRELQEWLGHADLKTTQRYLHYRTRGDEARRLSGAFELQAPLQANAFHETATGFRETTAEKVETPVDTGDSVEPGGTGRTP
jgi:integrase